MKETLEIDTVMVSAATALSKLKAPELLGISWEDLTWRLKEELPVVKASSQLRLGIILF